MIDWSCCPAVERSAERCSGARVFRGTSIPVAALFEHLESHASIGMFIEWFPGVTLTHVRSVLTHNARSASAEQAHDVPRVTEGGARMSGLHAAIFCGRRVPVRILLDYLTAGETLDAFLTDFPSVSREHAVAVLHLAINSLDALAV